MNPKILKTSNPIENPIANEIKTFEILTLKHFRTFISLRMRSTDTDLFIFN